MAETFQFDKIENVQIPCLLNRKIDNGRLKLIKRIGHGGYSVVYLAVNLSHHSRSAYPSRVAVKCLLSNRHQKFQREIDLHKRAARHVPGVIKIYRTLQEGDLFFVILDYCPHGDLFSAITESRIFLGNDRLIKGIFIQLIDIVMCMHNVGIYHRDLKPENVLCVSSPKHGGLPTGVILADFGLATQNLKSESFGCGSYFYMTPECLAGTYSTRVKPYSSPAADIWALGIMLVNLICGRSPWKAATLTDPSYRRFTRDCRWLRQMLPLSMSAYRFLAWIFKNHGNNISMLELRRQFLSIDTFYMTREELATADKTARLVASDWMTDASLQNFEREGLDITRVDEVDETQLFDDSIYVNPEDRDSNTSSSSTCSNADTDTYSFSSSVPSSTWTTPFSSVGGPFTTRSGSSAESDFPITPETKPIHPTEKVPELPKGQRPMADENWVLSADEVRSFHRTLSDHVIETAKHGIDRLVL